MNERRNEGASTRISIDKINSELRSNKVIAISIICVIFRGSYRYHYNKMFLDLEYKVSSFLISPFTTNPSCPSLLYGSMATSDMDPNRGAVAPYESNVGGRHQGSRLLRLIPLFGAPKWHPSKNWEMGGAPGLGGRHSTMIHNNQPSDGLGSGGGMGEETRPGGMCERGRLPVV